MGAEKPLLQGLFPVSVNVGEEAFLSNIKSAITRDLSWLQQVEAHDGHAVIVGGGPSLADCAGELAWRASIGQTFFALNNTAGWLAERGIVPEYHVLLDARPSVARFVRDNEKTRHLVASQCNPWVFDIAKRVTLWHPNVDGIRELIGERECALIGGGTTVGLQAMSVAFAMGYRKIHLYGFDSSYRAEEGHAYPQPENDGEPLVEVLFAGRRFMCANWMIRQAEEFKGVLRQLVEHDCVVTMSGDGFLPETFRDMLKTTLTAVYDLAVSPPTYDFLSFLIEAEKARIAAGHTHLDIVFMPGPVGGFRDDNLPPSLAEREGMLHRVCVSACRLLPSVRNVTVRKDRQEVSGNIFPEGWTVLTPVSRYGIRYFKNAHRVLRATESTKKAMRREKPYVTITLRQSEHWTDRNSNIPEWQRAAYHIRSIGYDVVWLSDTSVSADAASWDIDLRLAIYEGAVCNLGVNNGPMALLLVSEAPYILFKIITSSAIATTKEFLRSHGMEDGDQWGENGKTVWAEDTAETILEAFNGFIKLKEAA